MELPNKLIEDVKRQEAKEEAIFNKIKSTVMYRRRKIDKDVRQYTRDANPILFQSIERIGRSHKFYVEGTPFRESEAPHEDA